MVIDTSVLVSAFAFGGAPEKAVKKAFTESEIYVSQPLLKEYRSIPLELETEGKINIIQLKALITGIAAFVSRAKLVEPQRKLSICRDPEDNMLLECCVAAGANMLITGDKDLLDIKELPLRLKILTPRQYLQNA